MPCHEEERENLQPSRFLMTPGTCVNRGEEKARKESTDAFTHAGRANQISSGDPRQVAFSTWHCIHVACVAPITFPSQTCKPLARLVSARLPMQMQEQQDQQPVVCYVAVLHPICTQGVAHAAATGHVWNFPSTPAQCFHAPSLFGAPLVRPDRFPQPGKGLLDAKNAYSYSVSYAWNGVQVVHTTLWQLCDSYHGCIIVQEDGYAMRATVALENPVPQ